jgi:hypothetical protein
MFGVSEHGFPARRTTANGIFRVPFDQLDECGLSTGSEFVPIGEGELLRISSVTVVTGPQKS